jgi:hypothetical protein
MCHCLGPIKGSMLETPKDVAVKFANCSVSCFVYFEYQILLFMYIIVEITERKSFCWTCLRCFHCFEGNYL